MKIEHVTELAEDFGNKDEKTQQAFISAVADEFEIASEPKKPKVKLETKLILGLLALTLGYFAGHAYWYYM